MKPFQDKLSGYHFLMLLFAIQNLCYVASSTSLPTTLQLTVNNMTSTKLTENTELIKETVAAYYHDKCTESSSTYNDCCSTTNMANKYSRNHIVQTGKSSISIETLNSSTTKIKNLNVTVSASIYSIICATYTYNTTNGECMPVSGSNLPVTNENYCLIGRWDLTDHTKEKNTGLNQQVISSYDAGAVYTQRKTYLEFPESTEKGRLRIQNLNYTTFKKVTFGMWLYLTKIVTKEYALQCRLTYQGDIRTSWKIGMYDSDCKVHPVNNKHSFMPFKYNQQYMPSKDTWYFMTCMYNPGGHATTYEDGEFITSETANSSLPSFQNVCFLGGDGKITNNSFIGYIKYFFISGRILSIDEMNTMKNTTSDSTTFYDYSTSDTALSTSFTVNDRLNLKFSEKKSTWGSQVDGDTSGHTSATTTRAAAAAASGDSSADPTIKPSLIWSVILYITTFYILMKNPMYHQD